jgi:hypothetical protein
VDTKSLQLYRPAEYVTLAKLDLTQEDITALAEYAATGGHPLSPDIAAKFFGLFLNGSDAHEIQRLNKAFKLGQILDAQVRYKWSEQREKYSIELQSRAAGLAMKAQLETTELMSNLLAAANRQHGDKLKKFIQTGDEKDLDGALSVASIKTLLDVVDGLLKITGQDRVSKVKVSTTNTQNLNVNVNGAEGLVPEDAAKILEIIAASKRKKNDTVS